MKNKQFLKRISVVVTLLMVLSAATYAWFAMWDHANVQSMDSLITKAGYIRISGDNGASWENNLTLNLGEANVLGELSGDGLKLYQPNYGVTGIDRYRLYTEDKLYVEKTFTLESDLTQDLYLTKNSFVAPADVTGNFSAYGNYSRDYIAGAIRVAFYDITNAAQPKLIYLWAPNATYEYAEYVDAETEETVSEVKENGYVEANYTYQVGTAVEQTVVVPTNGAASGVSEDGTFMWGSPSQPAAKPLVSFATQNGEPVRQKLMVRVFLEGSDRECVRQLHNGKIRVYLEFSSDKEGTVNG